MRRKQERVLVKYDFNNFYFSTIANFIRCDLPISLPDYYSFTGSTYWDLGDRVIRWSNHWGTVRSCLWYFEGKNPYGLCLCGYVLYKDLKHVDQRFLEEYWYDGTNKSS